MPGTLERRERQEAIVRLLRDAEDPYSAFLDADPYSAEYGPRLAERSNEISCPVWSKLCMALPYSRPVSVLDNVWAAAAAEPKWLAIITRAIAATGDPNLQDEVRRLVGLTSSVIERDPTAWALVMCDRPGLQTPPKVDKQVKWRPAARLCYRLAHHWARGATSRELLETAAAEAVIRPYLRHRELARALRAHHAMRLPVPAMSETEFLMLPHHLQDIAIATPQLRALLLPGELANSADLGRIVEVSRVTRRLAEQALGALRDRLLAHDLAQVEALLATVASDAITKTLAAAMLGELPLPRSVTKVPAKAVNPKRHAPAVAPWVPLSGGAIQRLAELAPRLRLPIWWSLSGDHVARRIADGTLDLGTIPRSDLTRIRQTWQRAEYALLAAANHYQLLSPDSEEWDRLDLSCLLRAASNHTARDEIVVRRVRSLADARPVLALLAGASGPDIKARASAALRVGAPGHRRNSWGSWVANCIGTAEWLANERLATVGAKPIARALALLRSGASPLEIAGFRTAVCARLARRRSSGLKTAEIIAEFLSLDPGALGEVCERLPVSHLRPFVRLEGVPLAILERMVAIAPAELRDELWCARIRRVDEASLLCRMLLEGPGRPDICPWNSAWLEIKGSPAERAMALILATRRNARNLVRVAERVGWADFLVGLRNAVDSLPSSARRDRGFLELVAVLGESEILHLSAVMTIAKREAPSGNKLAGAYRQYTLPKKSGGKRVISVPCYSLKRVQRAILRKLLDPLGAHECAFGFVAKRSIAQNAAIHVSQLIVANADVSNCFPSVKWPLVLGVLRRDLSGQLGPGAISLLVDICTAKGGLPIGAPTSPALLNRVLLRTDQVLQEAAAARKCRYTRYADDLTFSGDHAAVKMLGIAKRTLSQIGLALDDKKTTIYRPGRRQIVTGLVVNKQVSVPRRIRRRIRAAVHALERGGNATWHGQDATVASIQGRVAFLSQIHPVQGACLAARLRRSMQAKKEPRDT